MTTLQSIGALLGRSVMLGDIRLGVCGDALVDRSLRRLVGLEIHSGDEAHRFLPFPAFELREHVLAVESALVLLDRELDFYRGGGNAFSDLRGLPVRVSGSDVGQLVDLLADREGDIRGIVVLTSQGELELEPGPGVVVGNHFLRPAV